MTSFAQQALKKRQAMKDIVLIVIIIGVIWLLTKQSQMISNEEAWSWIDYKGNQRRMTVYRNVKAS